ncbi:MAG: FAD binding domain-containing protein [bacterium]|nr:FAD binding domain-containing protein [bacterium]
MDQNTVKEFVVPPVEDPLAEWRDGDAWLAGGTLIYSTPMPHLRRLRDLSRMGWPNIVVHDEGLEIAATCEVVELHDFDPPHDWAAGPFLRQCVEEYLAGFKVWNRQTVGGNICASLPAGPMITMAVALEAQYTLWAVDGTVRVVSALDFVTGDNTNILKPGELLRSIFVPMSSLTRHYAIRRFSLTKHGRSSIFLVGSTSPGELLITVTAATSRPVLLRLPRTASADEVRDALDTLVPDGLYFDDPNGTPAHRRHMTHVYAKQIRDELVGGIGRG